MQRGSALRACVLELGVLAAFALAAAGTVSAQTVQRSLDDFINAQGTTSDFFAPFPDYVGWADNPCTRFALIDYTGLAARYLRDHGGPLIPTQVTGQVTERPLADGRAEVTAILYTRNAISWAADCTGDPFNDPPLYGYRPAELLADPALQPAYSETHFKVVFTNTAPGAPLPDVVDAFILGNAAPGQELRQLSFYSNGFGPLRAGFGVPEGSRGRLTVTETGLFQTSFKGATADAFPVEGVRLQAVDPSPKPLLITPVGAMPYGKSYGEWTAEWWKWALSIPLATNPLNDQTGANAASGQSGPVWFLAGTFCADLNAGCDFATASREINVPSGKALFFPILNAECSTFEGNGTTDADLRACAASSMDLATGLACEVDDIPVTDLPSYRVQSPSFTWGPLPADNMLLAFGVDAPAGTTSPAVGDGIYLMLPPLHPGTHRIHFTGFFGIFFGLDVEYVIHVVPGGGSSGASLAASVYPNPLNPAATLRYVTTRPGPVRVDVFDLAGRLVRTVVRSTYQEAGTHVVQIEGVGKNVPSLASGVYYFRVRAAEGETTGRFTVLK
jgi:hypothetical protein